MRKSATILAIAALGAMLAAGSVTESMAQGGGGGHGGGGHSFVGSRGDFGGARSAYEQLAARSFPAWSPAVPPTP